MQYVLGNMLNGGGINPDGLSLDLQFAADKTLTARRGPTPVFTRSSGDNGGTTYFGPLVDFDLLSEIPATGITNGRASWFKSDGGIDITISYTGTKWRAVVVDNGNTDEYLAATGGEWRPDQADWSGVEFSVTTSSTFGIVKAANNEPRFDHDPVTGVCRGLLIEEGRTNLFSRSEEFNETAWLKLRSSISANSTVSPSGDNSADKLVEDASNNTHMVYRTLNTGSLVAHTFSVFAKADGRNFVYLDCGDGFPLNSNAYFNLSNGTLGTIGASATATITAFGNGWYRCSVTATPTSTTTNGFYIQIASANGTRFYQGDGASGIFIWGAQLEAGSFPTSYIPTTTGTLARSADVCNITGGDFNNFYNQSEGTLFAECQTPSANQYAGIAVIGTTSFNHNIALFKSDATGGTVGNRFVPYVTQGGTLVAIYDFGNESGNGNLKVLASVALNNMIFARNGTLSPLDSTAAMPTPNRITIGGRADGNYINGHIAAIRYYKKRLPNAKLVTLTT
jgi:hypothetical protein